MVFVCLSYEHCVITYKSTQHFAVFIVFFSRRVEKRQRLIVQGSSNGRADAELYRDCLILKIVHGITHGSRSVFEM